MFNVVFLDISKAAYAILHNIFECFIQLWDKQVCITLGEEQAQRIVVNGTAAGGRWGAGWQLALCPSSRESKLHFGMR